MSSGIFPGKIVSPMRAIVRMGDDEFEAYVLNIDYDINTMEDSDVMTLRVKATGSPIMNNFYSYTARTLLERMLIKAQDHGEEKSVEEIMGALCMLDL